MEEEGAGGGGRWPGPLGLSWLTSAWSWEEEQEWVMLLRRQGPRHRTLSQCWLVSAPPAEWLEMTAKRLARDPGSAVWAGLSGEVSAVAGLPPVSAVALPVSRGGGSLATRV